MEVLIYDNGIITEHKLYPVCGKKLQDVSEKDYHGKKYFDEHIECLDMDEYEKKACRAGKCIVCMFSGLNTPKLQIPGRHTGVGPL